jgi:hypothetical protein
MSKKTRSRMGLVAETIGEKGVDERIGVVEAAVGEGETVYP